MNSAGRKKFSDVEVEGKFIFRNCLFKKISAEAGIPQGDKTPRKFKPDDEVGIVMASARAPEPEITDQEDDNPNEGEDE